jgi:hypothetical protein
MKTFLLLSELLSNLATDCLPRICLRGNLFTNPLPSIGCTCNNILESVLVVKAPDDLKQDFHPWLRRYLSHAKSGHRKLTSVGSNF